MNQADEQSSDILLKRMIHDAINQGFRNLGAKLHQEGLERAVKRQINDRVNMSRIVNRGASSGEALLSPLPLPDGSKPGKIFPRTPGVLRNMSESALDHFMECYMLATEENMSLDVDAKRKLVALHSGIRLSLMK
ncbi:unnamed protein product [Rhizoctonia solani]|uniref:Uncharacterized protein n=1 Tax=Rhizoctonia solani TaxID=456999 RepID=A0A8H3H8F9_9AGAM|nr:unnamed protein product [Rhizoctonia solani]